jgi:hypothetical protein
VLVASSELGLPDAGVQIENPFELTAIDLWQRLLREGHRITAVSGSDSKGVEPDARRRWGTNATAVYAEELSRPALFEALRAGHAYVQTHGAHGSPSLELTGVAAGGATAMMGDTLVADAATLSATVTGGTGQLLLITKDGLPWGFPVPITSDPFTFTWRADRSDLSGSLGTFWRVDTRDLQTYTTISNPIFLNDTAPPVASTTTTGAGPATTTSSVPSRAGAAGATATLPATGDETPLVVVAVLLLVASFGRRVAGAADALPSGYPTARTTPTKAVCAARKPNIRLR